VTASRTLRAIGPAQSGNGINANLLIGEVLDCSLECFWLFHSFKVLE